MVAFSSSTVSTISSLVIINAICDKIGIVYDKAVGLVPYIVRYNITHDVIMLIIGLAFILTGALLWRKGGQTHARRHEAGRQQQLGLLRR